MAKVLIGGHVSAAGGLWNAIANANAIGAEAIQIFGSSPRQWSVTAHTEEDFAKFRAEAKSAKMGPVFLHAPYLANLASPKASLRAMSARLLGAHLKIANAINARGLIFHIGSGKEMPREEAFRVVVSALKDILKKVLGKSMLVIENSAGGGQSIGASLEEIALIIKGVGSSRVGVCFDTAHAFESGLIEGYTLETVDALALQIKKTITFRRLLALHVNDSKTAFNSHHDRHENIGRGYIGLEGFRALINHPDFQKPPWLLEVPGFKNEGPDRKNIKILKGLIKK